MDEIHQQIKEKTDFSNSPLHGRIRGGEWVNTYVIEQFQNSRVWGPPRLSGTFIIGEGLETAVKKVVHRG